MQTVWLLVRMGEQSWEGVDHRTILSEAGRDRSLVGRANSSRVKTHRSGRLLDDENTEGDD